MIRTKKSYLISLTMALVLTMMDLVFASFYYNEDFSSGSAFSNRWNCDYRYGREGFILDNASTSSRVVSANKLNITRMPLNNDGNYSYHTIFVGRCVKLTNVNGRRSFNASEYEPFGFEVVRNSASLWHGNDGGWPEDCGDINIWLIEENNVKQSNWKQLDNFIYIFEGLKNGVWGTRSRWVVYKGAENRCFLTNVNRPDSKMVNLTTGPYDLEYDYTARPNNNMVGVRVTYDGSRVKFYLNPNPGSKNTYPNEYCFLKDTSFPITNRLRVMLGHENNGTWPQDPNQTWNVFYTNFLIRTICKSLNAGISPRGVTKSSIITYTNIVNSTYSNTDSGIGELLLVKPAGFSKWSNLQVWTNNVKMSNITSGTQVGDGQVLITTNTNNLKIRFLQNAPSTAGVIKKDSLVMKIVFTLTAPSNASPTGLEFRTYADCVKYNYTGYGLWATTGKKRAYPVSSEAMLVKVYNQPKAVASITPNTLYESTSDFIFTYKIATTAVNDGPNISRALINIPAGFVVYRNEVDSSLISTNFVFITNGNDILLKYADAGTYIPGQNGIDQIIFKVHNTPVSGTYQLSSQVESVIEGASPQFTTTNSVYQSQAVWVKPEKPMVFAYIQPDHIYNISSTNILSYYLLNNGGMWNNIRKAKIFLPGIFTNVRKVSSDTVSTQYMAYNKATNFIVVDYQAGGTNLGAGKFDRVRIKVWDNIPAGKTTNVDLTSQADNGNGDGYVDSTEDVLGWSLAVVDPVAEGQASLFTNTRYTTDATNSFTYRIFNSAVMPGNNVYQARIVIPRMFTNIMNVRSSQITNDSNTNFILVKSNVIYLKYYKESTNTILPQAGLDTITFKLYDKITLPSTFTLQGYVANSTNTNSFRVTGDYLTGNKVLNIIDPDISADAYVLPNSLDATTTTNTMTLYIRNTGLQQNEVKFVRVTISTSFITNVDNLSSKVITNLPGVNVKYVRPDILLRYENDGSPLITGKTDVVRFRMQDKVLGGATLIFSVSGSNVKHYQALPATPARSLQVSFALPDPVAQGSVQPNVLFTSTTKKTDTLVYKVTNKGGGSNNLKKIKLFLQALLMKKVTAVSNTWWPAKTMITASSDSIVLEYTNYLTTGNNDLIFLKITNTVSVPGTNCYIPMAADNENGNGFVSGLTNQSISRKVTFTKQPDVSISPTWVYTTSLSNSFSYTIKNGSVGGLALKKAMIIIPAPVFITNRLKLMGNTWYTQFTLLQIKSNGMIIDYSAKPLDPDNADIISFNVQDSFLTGTTNVALTAYVDYGDGFGWRATTVKLGNTNSVAFVMPPATAKVDFTPKQVGTDDTSTVYTLYLTNDGVIGNNIKMARVNVPPEINNVTFITSALIGNNATFTNGFILVNYEKYSSFVPVNSKDVITFRGSDSVTIPTMTSWAVKVANTTNTNDLVLATSLYSNSFDLTFFLPDYGSEFYVTPNYIDTSFSITVMTMFVKNKGGALNDIKYVKIYYPSLFTNVSLIGSTRATNIALISNGIVELCYNPTNFKPGRSDRIVFTVQDSLVQGSSNVSFGLKVNFTTSGINFINSDVVTGKSKDVSFVMPFPLAEAVLSPNEVYTSSRTNTVRFKVVNKGHGSNNLTEVKIFVPSSFTNQLGITGSLATNQNYSSSFVTLKYNNLPTSITDAFFISFVNTSTDQASSKNWSCTVSNGFYRAMVASNSSGLSIVTPPSAYAAPDKVYSTDVTNTVTFRLYNDGSGTSALHRAQVVVPAVFTNIISVQSTKLASLLNITNKRTSVILNYAQDANGSLLDNESDMITIRMIDNLSEGTETARWGIKGDNGSGYAETVVYSGRSMQTFLTNPSVLGSSYLLTRWVYNSKKSNAVQYVVRNEGKGSNNIKKAVILFTNASQFTQITGVESTHMATSANIHFNLTSVTLYYEMDPNGSLLPGESDTITLGCIHKVPDGSTPEQYIPCLAYNWLGPDILPVPSGYPDDSQTLLFKTRPEPPWAYIYGVNQAFTMNTNVVIRYKVENNSYDTPVEKIRITFDTSNFRITSMDSLGVTANDNLMLEVHTNYILLDYSKVSNSIKARQSDIISLYASYHIASEFSFAMNCEVFYQGAPIWDTALKKTGETNILWVKKASWGKIIGRIVPTRIGANVLLLRSGTETPVYPHSQAPLTSDEKAVAISGVSIVSENNTFVLDFVPAGIYDIKGSALGYYNYKYKLNVSVSTNAITDVGVLELYSEPISASSLDVQKRRCINTNYDDVDILIIPTGSIHEDYIADIRANYFTEEQQNNVRMNRSIRNIDSSADIVAFDIKLYNLNLEDLNIYGVPLDKEWTVNIPYDKSVVLSKGWQETDLAIFYWDDLVRKWFKVGGRVNTEGNYVTASISFLSRRYAVLAQNTTTSGKVYDVAVDNNPFTPLGASGEYSRTKINFRVEEGVQNVEARILNLFGEEIYYTKPNISFDQGSFWWDGKNKQGVVVKSGTYLFQIKAGDFVHTGAILLIK